MLPAVLAARDAQSVDEVVVLQSQQPPRLTTAAPKAPQVPVGWKPRP